MNHDRQYLLIYNNPSRWLLASGERGLLGGVLGVGAVGGSYEYHLKRQKDRVEADFKAGKIEQKEYDIRKDQVSKDSFFQK